MFKFAIALVAGLASIPAQAQDSGTIKMVQVILYNLNFDVDNQDGILTPKTGDMIFLYRNQVKLSPGRHIDEDLLDRLRAAQLPKLWGAIGMSSQDGKFFPVAGISGRADAERLAKEGCDRVKSGGTCLVTAGTEGQWLAAVFCRMPQTNQGYASTAASSSLDKVIESVYRNPDAKKIPRNRCELKAAFPGRGPAPDVTLPPPGRGA